MLKIRFLLTCLTLMATLSAYGRWATPEEVGLEYLDFTRDIIVKADGTSEETIEQKVKILNESGRDEAKTVNLLAWGGSGKITVISAYTEINGQRYPVNPATIETKPLASNPQGFDDIHQTLIAFPKAEIGSILHLKYKETTHTTATKNHYDTSFNYGQNILWLKSKVTVKSALPFQIEINDPSDHLKITQGQDKKNHTLTITLKKPCFIGTTSESGQLRHSKKVWVKLSTLKTYADLGSLFNKDYNTIASQPLPTVFQEIAHQASLQTNPIDQINTVTSLLSQKVHYMGDWKKVNGSYIPRSLKTVAQTGYGDCKDFATVTVAILRSLGIKAYNCCVFRGADYQNETFSNSLPSAGDFNHAMVKVITKDNQTLWIDPTNFISQAGNLFSDIADRSILVLYPDKPALEYIPPIDPNHAQVNTRSVISLHPNNTWDKAGSATFIGEEASSFTGLELHASQDQITDILINSMANSTGATHKKSILPDLKSRIVQDVTFRYSMTESHQELITNVGIGVPIDNDTLSAITNAEIDQVGDIIQHTPYSFKHETFLQGVKAENLSNLKGEITTPWARIKRTLTQTPQGIRILTQGAILKQFIPAEEIQTPIFQRAVTDINRLFKNVAIIVTPMDINGVQSK